MLTGKNSRCKAWLYCFAAAVALLAVCSKSSPLYPLNDWMDANIFYTTGKAMMNGRVLYRDVFDHKGPLLYLVYGLGWLLNHQGFSGVWLLEIVAFATFLNAGLRTAELFAGSLHPAWVLLPGAVVAAGKSFAHGGSAEELCLPLLGWSVYILLRLLVAQPRGRRPLPLWQAACLGGAAGCVLWTKFTLLGLLAGVALVLAVIYLHAGWFRKFWQSVAAYLVGFAAAFLPWLLYFAANDALGDLFAVYFGDNLFLYSGQTNGASAFTLLLNMVQRLYWAVHDTPLIALLAGIGIAWLLWRRRWSCVAALTVMGICFSVTAFAFGSYHVYYALPLAVFAPLGLIPVKELRLPPVQVRRWLPGAGLAAAAIFCLCLSPNTDQLLRPREALPQWQFAHLIQRTDGATLLNYGTLDGGFYTTSGLLPPCRYFCVTNLPLPEQQRQQDALLQAGEVMYVVALQDDLTARFPRYVLLDQATYNGGEGPLTWYLYRVTR